MTIKSITSNQHKQVLRFMEDGLDASSLDKDSAQRIIEHGDDMQTKLKKMLHELSTSDRYADEEVKSIYVYPSKYSVKGITEQTNKLRELFPGIGYADEDVASQTLPDNSEGWFAIPKWEKFAKTYGEALEKIFEAIKQTRNGKFYNYRKNQLGPRYLRQQERTVQMIKEISNQQKNDILVIPAQFGMRHRGRSVRRAREVFIANEFGLGSFAIGCMLLTHPERLVSYSDLWIDCSGDEFSPHTTGQFAYAPYFRFDVGRVEFGTLWSDDAYSDDYGSVSAFLPQ